jgi:3-hydroxybutyryl-CoA dehydratase
MGGRMIKKKFEDIQIGEKVSFGKTITEADVFAFAGITADFNPIHVNVEFAKKSFFGKRVAHGMLTAGLINQTLTNLGGLGTIHLTQTVKFMAPVFIGDTVTVASEVVSKDSGKNRMTVKSTVTNQEGKTVLEGEALILMPKEK